jgi:hypothetical protein
MEFKEHYFVEKTYNLSSDVRDIYVKYFKDLVRAYTDPRGGKLEFPSKKISSADLTSKDAIAAHKINPIDIYIDWKNSKGSTYSPTKKRIVLTINKSARDLVKKYKTLDNAAKNMKMQSKVKNLYNLFNPDNIKGTISHEISHWINDSLHGQHLQRTKEKYQRRNKIPDDVTADYEVDAQIHTLKELYKGLGKREWDLLTFNDLIDKSAGMDRVVSVLKGIGDDGAILKQWIKNILKRLVREDILGSNMNKVNYTKL